MSLDDVIDQVALAIDTIVQSYSDSYTALKPGPSRHHDALRYAELSATSLRQLGPTCGDPHHWSDLAGDLVTSVLRQDLSPERIGRIACSIPEDDAICLCDAQDGLPDRDQLNQARRLLVKLVIEWLDDLRVRS